MFITRRQYYKLSGLLKVIHRFNAFLIKSPMAFCADVEVPIFKFMWNYKELQIAETVLKKMNKIGGLTLPDFNMDHKATAITQCSSSIRIGILIHGTELKAQVCSTDFQQGCQDHSMVIIFSISSAGTTWYPHEKNQSVPVSHHIRRFALKGLKTFI